MAKKFLTHNRYADGLEAPRNSLELPPGTLQGYLSVAEITPYTCQVKEEWSDKHLVNEASMKNLIKEEISKGPNTRRNRPSIVARLMGMDMLPGSTSMVVQTIERTNKKAGTNSQYNKQSQKNCSAGQAPLKPTSLKQLEVDSFRFSNNKERNPEGYGRGLKPARREHPQEAELQMFKKEFEAWQAARFRDCSRFVNLDTISSRQSVPHENLNLKISPYLNSTRESTSSEKPIELKGRVIKEMGCHQTHAQKKELLWQADQNEYVSSITGTKIRNPDKPSLRSIEKKLGKSFGPTRIVILKPGPDRIGEIEEFPTSTRSSGASEERESNNMEDFLEEVKQRLRNEMQENSLLVRGGGIETPFSEKPSDPKKIARHIAKQVRNSVDRDLGAANLLRSESTRSCRSETHFDGPDSPKFMNRDTRRILSERFRNVLKGDACRHIPAIERRTKEQAVDISTTGNKKSYWENLKDELETQNSCFIRGLNNDDGDDEILNKEVSPTNLLRSLSAPVSGTSFGKLLLEDRHILTGAHIRRKHEAIENVKKKKERFNFREKVSNFRYGFPLRKRLFGRKIFQSMEELQSDDYAIDYNHMKSIMSGPTVMMSFGDKHENSTEVPPSPASVCSDGYEELWGPADHLTQSPTSVEDHHVPEAIRETSFNLAELQVQPNGLGSDGSEGTASKGKEELLETKMVELEDQVEAYVRDLLIASGLFGGSTDKYVSRWDLLAKPVITDRVFEEVEESYRKMAKETEGPINDNAEKQVNHKVVLDLLNETLITILGSPLTRCRSRRNIIGAAMFPLPHGRHLLDLVWETIRMYVYPPADGSYYLLENMVARDLRSMPWPGRTTDDLISIVKEIESHVIGDLIEEILDRT